MKIKILIAAYALSGVIAFGHSASNVSCEYINSATCSEKKAMGGLMAGLFNPLYWSWTLMERSK